MDYSKYVHEYEDENGKTMYAVARWDEHAAEWICPLDARTRKLTGCYAEFAKRLSGLGGYRTRRQALRRARYLFGESDN